MTNVSKNIRRLRREKTLTQEQLAEQLHVTRQTVSSWENNRTQPDIDMLAGLAAAFETDIETLIYGKRHNTSLAPDVSENRRLLLLVLTVFGTLLSAAGVILIFVFLWQKLPALVRYVLAFLPLLVGGGAGAASLFYKRGVSQTLREGASVLWIAGVIAANALVNGLFMTEIGFENLLLIDVILLTPVMFLLRAAAPFAATAVMSCWCMALVADSDRFYIFRCLFLLYIAVGEWFLQTVSLPQTVKKCAAWIQTLRMGFFAAIICFMFKSVDIWFLPSLLAAYCLQLSAAGEDKRYSLRLLYPGMFGACVFAVLCFVWYMPGVFDTAYWTDMRPVSVLALLVWAVGFAVGFRRMKKDALLLAGQGCMGVFFALQLLAGWVPFEPFQIILPLLCLSYCITVLLYGVKNARLSAANVGMLSISAILFVFYFRWFEDENLFVPGLLLVCTGAALLIANRVLIKRFRAKKAGPGTDKGQETGTETEVDGRA